MNREDIFETLKIDEGVKYEIYADHLGYHTFGVGHLVINEDTEWGQEFGTPISEKRVWECFEKDLDTAISECHALYTESVFDDFPEEVQQIVVNMMFNMGRTRLSKFKKFTGALIIGDWKEAAVEGRDSRWHKQVTNRAERLMVRMEAV
jgi:GH24 family phage-related lysozyme (muramidase)